MDSLAFVTANFIPSGLQNWLSQLFALPTCAISVLDDGVLQRAHSYLVLYGLDTLRVMFNIE